MTRITTAGPVRGLLARWVMRFEAAGQIINMGFQGVTAVSALSGVLAFTGHQHVVPWVLAIGCVGVFVFAFVYVEWGVYNRKNREKQDRGNNFAKPQNLIDDVMIARGVASALEGAELDTDRRDATEAEVLAAFRQYRNGVEVS